MPDDQADMLKEFCEMLKADKEKWLSGFTLYQMRDRGRLGLEIEDPEQCECWYRTANFEYVS